MSTEFLREKINVLNNMVQQAVLEQFQLQIAIEVASQSTGDAQIDANLLAAATNAKGQLLACERRLVVCRARLIELQTELDA